MPIVTEIDGGLIRSHGSPRRKIKDLNLDIFDADEGTTRTYTCEPYPKMHKNFKTMSHRLAREALKTLGDHYGGLYKIKSVEKAAINTHLEYYITFTATKYDGDNDKVGQTKNIRAIVSSRGVRSFVLFVRIIPSTPKST